jgi:hypothetical protein
MTEEGSQLDNINLCECGCGQQCKKRFVSHHHRRGQEGLKGDTNPAWKGGRTIDTQGYIKIFKPNHPFCDHQGYVREHRLVMEEYLGRFLTRKEEVHHIDGNKENNRIGNLMLFPNSSEHSRYENTGLKRGNKILIDMSGRVCLLCNSVETYIKKGNGRPQWKKYKNGFICSRCYMKKIYRNEERHKTR